MGGDPFFGPVGPAGEDIAAWTGAGHPGDWQLGNGLPAFTDPHAFDPGAFDLHRIDTAIAHMESFA